MIKTPPKATNAVVLLFLLLANCSSVAAIDEFGDLKTIRSLPNSDRDLELAHGRSRGEACETLPEGLSMEVNSFASVLTERDKQESQKRRLIPAARHNLFSVGLKIGSVDRREMPVVSRGAILDYLDSNYVAIQARVRRDLLDRKLYYHHRPIALTAQYRSGNLTKDFEPVVASNIRDFHSLGLFTRKTGILKPEDLRTIVLAFRYKIHLGGKRTKDQFEFVFVRGREAEARDKERLTPHVFVTTDNRTQLRYVNPFKTPFSQRSCSIQGSIVITKYDSSGIYPRDSATRSYVVDTQQQFAIDRINAECRTRGMIGGLSENLDRVLDLIIDGELDGLATGN